MPITRPLALASLLTLVLALTGCGIAPQSTASAAGAALQGRVQGGQQPVIGAQVYLFAANTTGYGAPSVSLLAPTGLNTHLDTAGNYYVLTDTTGSFSITGDYTCSPGAQVYLYALGGNPGSGTNTAASLMAVLGQCPTTGTFLATTPYIWINEVSTVAAAYSFAGFATDSTHVSSSGTAAAKIGVANAFANAANLVSLSTGVALALTPAGNGTVQQLNINALANVLVSCVNSTGPTSTTCSTLFTNTLSGGLTGTRPTETATAAINIAHNPGVNVSQIYTLASPKVAFAPTLTAAPQDWHLSINYFTAGAIGFEDIAIDSYGNVWIPAYAGNSLVEFSPQGVLLSASASGIGYVGGGLSQPHHIAIDTSNNVWVSNDGKNTVGYYALSEFNNAGAVLSNSGYVCGSSSCSNLTIDPSGDIWAPSSNSSGYTLFEVLPSGATRTYGGVGSTLAIAADAQNHIWVPYDYNTNALAEFTTAGVVVPGSPFSGGGINIPRNTVFDANGTSWHANASSGNLSAFSSTGVPLSGSPFTISYSGSSLPLQLAVDGANSIWISNGGTYAVSRIDANGNLYPGMPFNNGVPVYTEGVAVDPSGNLWVSASGNTSSGQHDTISQFIGAAAPTITPVSLAVKNNTIGTRP